MLVVYVVLVSQLLAEGFNAVLDERLLSIDIQIAISFISITTERVAADFKNLEFLQVVCRHTQSIRYLNF